MITVAIKAVHLSGVTTNQVNFNYISSFDKSVS